MKSISISRFFVLLFLLTCPGRTQPGEEPTGARSLQRKNHTAAPVFKGHFISTVEEQGESFSVTWRFEHDSSFVFEARAKTNPKAASKSMRGKWSLQGRDLLASGTEAMVEGKWKKIPDDRFSILGFSDTTLIIDMHGKTMTLNRHQ